MPAIKEDVEILFYSNKFGYRTIVINFSFQFLNELGRIIKFKAETKDKLLKN